MPISNKTQTEPDEIIQKIELSNVIREKSKSGKWEFNERKISISKLISDLKSWIDHFDGQINEQFDEKENLEKHASDLIIQMKGKLI